MAIVARIVIDDDDRREAPSVPYTANLYDRFGRQLTEPGFGSTARIAILDLLANDLSAIKDGG